MVFLIGIKDDSRLLTGDLYSGPYLVVCVRGFSEEDSKALAIRAYNSVVRHSAETIIHCTLGIEGLSDSEVFDVLHDNDGSHPNKVSVGTIYSDVSVDFLRSAVSDVLNAYTLFIDAPSSSVL